MSLSPRNRWLLLVAGLLALVGGGVAAYFVWFRPAALPEPGSRLYKEYVRAFQVGVAALDAGDLNKDLAESKLSRAVELVPGEPAGWANRGLARLRNREYPQAAQDLKRAKQLAPESPEIEALLGHLAKSTGRPAEAVAHFRKALEKT